jgi:hypothetical protein
MENKQIKISKLSNKLNEELKSDWDIFDKIQRRIV